jgi:hypothetical protein
MEMRKWEATVMEDPNDQEQAMLQFPEEMMTALDWREGDVLLWGEPGDGTVVVRNLTLLERRGDATSVVVKKHQ